jgi:uncharacterized protein (UPF0332 family)
MIDDLKREGLIKTLPLDQKKVEDARALALRDVATARTLLDSNQDWAYNIAYNAVLQAGRALMFSKGYRPDGANQHISVVKFAGLFLDSNDSIIFDRMRRKRNRSVYDSAGSITESEAVFAAKQAEDLVKKIFAVIDKS